MKVRRVRSAALIALTAGVISAVPAAGASAATTPLAGGGSFARTVPFIDGTLYVFECHALAPGAVSTTVSSCNLNSSSGSVPAPPVTSPGPAAATYQGVSQAPNSSQLCWTVSATYSDGTAQTKSGCTAASPIAGAG